MKCKIKPPSLYARPTIVRIQSHHSPIFSIKTSPLISNLVCFTGMDGCIELFNHLYVYKYI